MKTKEDLLNAYVDAESSVIVERSGDFKSSFTELLKEVKEYANDLGIEWDDSLFPDYAWEIINRED